MVKQKMKNENSWDFRDDKEKLLSNIYTKQGYIVEEADRKYLKSLKKEIESAFIEFTGKSNSDITTCLEEAHNYVSNAESNNLRLFLLEKI